MKWLSHVRLFATPWTVACQAPPSMGFSRQEYWSGSPFSSPGDLPDPGIEPRSPALQAEALTSEPPGKPKLLLNNKGTLQVGQQDKQGEEMSSVEHFSVSPPGLFFLTVASFTE